MERIDPKTIGKRVAAYRKSLGMTAEDLARELAPEMSANAVTKLENGHRAQLSPDLLADLARVLGVSPLALLFPLENPDAELVVTGMKTTPRELGNWLLGLGPSDSVTETFRHLVLTEGQITETRVRIQSATGADLTQLQLELGDALALKELLEQKLAEARRRLKLDSDG